MCRNLGFVVSLYHSQSKRAPVEFQCPFSVLWLCTDRNPSTSYCTYVWTYDVYVYVHFLSKRIYVYMKESYNVTFTPTFWTNVCYNNPAAGVIEKCDILLSDSSNV